MVIEFPARAIENRWAEKIRSVHPDVDISEAACPGVVGWLDAFFAGAPAPAPYPEYLPRWLPPTPAQDAVWRALSEIPFGETRAYADIARSTDLHPRLVGKLNGANHLALWIPCHRVVGKSGALVGFGGGLDRKRWLLTHELRATGVVLRPT